MTETEKWNFLVQLDETFLKGAVILSEWVAFLVRDTDRAFAAGANLSCIITALAGIETHLRAEQGAKKQKLADLIDAADLENDLKQELHALRKYRNNWVHVSEPWEDSNLLDVPDHCDNELETMARRCSVALRRTIYTNPSI